MSLHFLRIIVAFFCFCFLAPGAGIVHASENTSIQLPWHHQFQFAGYYMAKERGFYQQEGLDVEIRDVTQGKNTVEEVVSSRADFGVTGSGLLIERSQGKPVVAVAAIFQQSPTVFLTLEQSGIHKPQDLIGKKVMLSPGFNSLSLIALLQQENIFDKIERIDTSFDYHSLLDGQTDVFNAYHTNEPYLLESEGYSPRVINPADYGIHFFGDTLFTSAPLLKNKPKLVEKFRTASIKGWEYALAHPDEAIKLIHDQYQSTKTTQQLQFEAVQITKIIQPELFKIGTMGLSRWAQITHHLIAMGAVPANFSLDNNFIYTPPAGIPWKKLWPLFLIISAVLAILITFLSVLAKSNYRLKIARREASASEQKFRLLADYTTDWEYWVDSQGAYVYISPSCESISGYTPAEFINNKQLLFQITDAAYVEEVRHHFATEGGDTSPMFALVFPITTKTGEKKWLEHSCQQIFDDNGLPAGRRANNRDITQRKMAEIKYESLVKEANIGISLAVEKTGEIIECNEAMALMFERSRDELIGQSQTILHPPEEEFKGFTRKFIQAQEFKDGALLKDQCITKSGKIFDVEIKSQAITINQEKVRLGFFTDISERLNLESQLQQKHKMEAIGYMAGGMAHNFNNNLSIILGNIELSLLKQPVDSDILPLLGNAKIAVHRSRDLVKKITTYSRKGALNKTPMQLPPIIDETISLLKPTLPSTIHLDHELTAEGQSAVIDADPSQVQEVLVNLCNNAVHAMDEKGSLKIKLDKINLEQTDIPTQYDAVPGPYAILSVHDTGCGIPAENLSKVFDPFFSTKEEHKGAGMGLSTVQGIIAQHNGIIILESTPNQETIFKLYFPIIEESSSSAQVSDTSMPRGTERILFVDDDENLAKLGERLLSEMGYQVSIMTDSREALKLFAANADCFQLMITDQTMPGLTGKELIQEVKQINPDLPIILCTGFSNKVNEEEARLLGVNAFCMKPLDLQKMLQTIRQVLDSKSNRGC